MNEVTLKLTVQQAEALKRLVSIQSTQSMTNTLTGISGGLAVRPMGEEEAANEARELWMMLYTMPGIITRAVEAAQPRKFIELRDPSVVLEPMSKLDPLPDFSTTDREDRAREEQELNEFVSNETFDDEADGDEA